MLVRYILSFLGGLSVFLLGVRFMIDYSSSLCVGRVERWLKKCSSNKTKAVLCGVGLSGIAQSSVAVNASLVGLVDNKTLTTQEACAIIIGTNIGTTVTTQIISLTGVGFNITLLACFIGFIGIIFSFFKGKVKDVGYLFLGFALIFTGLDLISQTADYFSSQPFFKSVFQTQNPLLLLLYGICIPAIMQSSSTLTGIMVVLAGKNLINFSQIAYLILGANVGSCFGVIFSSFDKGELAKITAIFNLVINFLGLVMFFPIVYFGSDFLSRALEFLSDYPQRKIANFHTIYNIVSGVMFLPFIGVINKFSYRILGLFGNKKTKTIDKGKIML